MLFATSTGYADGPAYIQTVAGTGVPSYNGDNITATNAYLNYPTGIAVDAEGNLFIVDYNNNRIREVVKATGAIMTVAGNGGAGYNGDNIVATDAALYHPVGVAIDAEGNLFIADQWNNRIREVIKATGQIITVAGNGGAGYSGDGMAATNSSLYYPTSVTFDTNGTLFIADQYNHRIREVVKATGIITTVAGTGGAGYNGDGMAATNAALYYPFDVAVDLYGNRFITDQSNHRIRAVARDSGIISTIAGNGGAGYNGDGMAATNAYLYNPLGITFDQSGALLITEL